MIEEHNEKRGFIRVAITSNVDFRRLGGRETNQGQTKDLSASGLCFTTPATVETGEVLEVTVHPGASITPPLEAKLTVTRVGRDEAARLYEVAGTLEH
ncbi:MAG TPA: PilZ domain-containing protein [Candidatus Tenderia sp.]|nr:PilZ domain-containing protein [Candidatus Tenderia sp.]